MPLPALPGMTGTGAPVTERLRYPFGDELGWYREYILLAPIFRGGVYFFAIESILEVIPNEQSQALWRKRTA